MSKKIAGLDLSWTSTGIAIWQRKLLYWWNPKTSKKDGSDEKRIAKISLFIAEVCLEHEVDLVVLEDLAYSRVRTIIRPAQLHAVVKHHLYMSGLRYVEVSSSSIKLWAAGDGRAGKSEMLVRAFSYLPGCPNDDVAEAIHIARYGNDHYSELVQKYLAAQ